MKYIQAAPGRIFAVKFESQEDILVGLKDLIKKEQIKSGIIWLIGALTNTDVVLGPERKEYPPKPVFWSFSDVKEIIATGLFAWENEEPKIHLHAGFGDKHEIKVGCIRNKTEVYLTVEGIIQEFIDTNISRKFDERYNASLLDFEKF
jgi:predicted DNA-binding protein with PD1-like motif